jgi:hypothetical protein
VKVLENVKILAKESLCHEELKQHKSWFDEERSKLLQRSKQAELQRLQNAGQMNEGNMKSVGCEASKTFRNKKEKCL